MQRHVKILNDVTECSSIKDPIRFLLAKRFFLCVCVCVRADTQVQIRR